MSLLWFLNFALVKTFPFLSCDILLWGCLTPLGWSFPSLPCHVMYYCGAVSPLWAWSFTRILLNSQDVNQHASLTCYTSWSADFKTQWFKIMSLELIAFAAWNVRPAKRLQCIVLIFLLSLCESNKILKNCELAKHTTFFSLLKTLISQLNEFRRKIF